MSRFLIGVGLIGTIVSFYFLLLSFLSMFPLFISAPLLFASIYLIVYQFHHRNRFRGF
ncbi:hypothetical protein P4637_10295 [Halalkalibacterium halodurans]|uniref:hypothetical protein n=1 Tax=Halalkalibacterium halodurans TaxID=86665 RepID=UPI0002FE665C|nr:hypothetical protein [Halalkalibacterium halodurans]MDY7223407.1 hypothetical protein [Halalkalibacterium halodurans]MDY7242628.1 hypothetical protein [Halalkalibacterium halodurans]MED3647319.1 hypothetical protein [Halalkalibacterium halodurans]MED4081665.1 hypothetical protein [Halalkalibacterium halodurans]MED4085218.1 hypothetical protein [Halalkalibacterium halodurans]